jgi:hypothetical protein
MAAPPLLANPATRTGGCGHVTQWLYLVICLRADALAARRDARGRFLMAKVEILRRKLGGNRAIPTPADRLRLLAIGCQLNHNVGDVLGNVTSAPTVSHARQPSPSAMHPLGKASCRNIPPD